MSPNPTIDVPLPHVGPRYPAGSLLVYPVDADNVPPFSSGQWRIHCRIGPSKSILVNLEWSEVDPEVMSMLGSLSLQVGSDAGAALLSPPHLNSVQFVFPRDGDRELWCDGDILAAASPYFRILLQPGFEEGELKKVKTQKPRRARQPLPFDDSDDDEALARTPPTPPPSRYSDYPHRRVEIYEASYTTYRAVLCWILTRHISFAPLHSTFDAEAPEERRAERTLTLETRTLASPKLPTPASPKSVYRLAHLLEMPELEELALASFARQLSAATFAQELFPEITGTYEKILDKIIDFIVETQDDLKDLYDWEELASIIGSIEGEPWGGEVVARAFAAFV